MSQRLIYLKDRDSLEEAEAEIKKREFTLRTMLQALPVACYVVDDRTDRILYFNSLFCDIWNIRHLEEDMRNGLLENSEVLLQCLPLVSGAHEYMEFCRQLQDENNREVVDDEIHLTDKRVIHRLSLQLRDDGDNYLGRLYVFGDITGPKLIEQRLKKKEEKYHQLFFNSPAVKILVDPENGDIVDANGAARKFYGYTARELRGMSIFDIILGEPSQVSQCLRSVNETGGRAFFFRNRLKNGEIRDVEVYSGPISVDGKKLVNSVIFDVTARLQAEEALRESRERLALVIDGAKAGVWDWDMVNNRVYHDRRWKAILGYEEYEITGGIEEWQSRWHPEDAGMIEEALRDHRERGAVKFDLEYRLRHKDGSYRWVHSTGRIEFDENRQPVRGVGSIIDVTAQKEVEQLRLESDKRLRDFAQAMPDINFILDEEGRHVEVFGNNEKLLPVPREELMGRTVHQVFPPNMADTLLEDVRQTIATGRQRRIVRLIDMGHDKQFIEARIAPMSYLANGLKTVVVSLTDISERRKAERMLQFTYELQQKSDFFNDIISGQSKIDANARLTAQKWGIDLSLPLFCCLINIAKAIGPDKKGHTMELKMQKNNIIKLLDGSPGHVIWDNRDGIGVLSQPRSNNENAWQKCVREAEQIREKADSLEKGLVLWIGVSDMHSGADSIMNSYREAHSAVISGKCREEEGGGVFLYRDIGLYQLLAALGGKEHAAGYVQKMIGPLLDYDREKRADLLSTLEAILQSGSLKEAAQRIFLHHKSLTFRKQRIEKILGVSLDSFETKLALAAAIKLHKLNNAVKN